MGNQIYHDIGPPVGRSETNRINDAKPTNCKHHRRCGSCAYNGSTVRDFYGWISVRASAYRSTYGNYGAHGTFLRTTRSDSPQGSRCGAYTHLSAEQKFIRSLRLRRMRRTWCRHCLQYATVCRLVWHKSNHWIAESPGSRPITFRIRCTPRLLEVYVVVLSTVRSNLKPSKKVSKKRCTENEIPVKYRTLTI